MITMLNARLLNTYLGTHYTLDEVDEMDWLTFEMLAAFQRGMNPPKKEKPSRE